MVCDRQDRKETDRVGEKEKGKQKAIEWTGEEDRPQEPAVPVVIIHILTHTHTHTYVFSFCFSSAAKPC